MQKKAAKKTRSNSNIIGPLIEIALSERILLSGETPNCRPRDCEFGPTSQTKITTMRFVFPRENAPVYLCYTLVKLKNYTEPNNERTI